MKLLALLGIVITAAFAQLNTTSSIYTYHVAQLPASPPQYFLAQVTDGANATDCATGGGTSRLFCTFITGTGWVATGGAGGTFSLNPATISALGGVTVPSAGHLTVDGSGNITLTQAGLLAALTFTPMNPANNFSDVANAATARNNIGLGAAATHGASATINGVTCTLDGTCTVSGGGGGTSAATYCAATVSNNSYTCAGNPVPTSYTGLVVWLTTTGSVNTGPSTLNIAGLGPVAIYYNQLPLTGGELSAAGSALIFDGTRLNLQNAPPCQVSTSLSTIQKTGSTGGCGLVDAVANVDYQAPITLPAMRTLLCGDSYLASTGFCQVPFITTSVAPSSQTTSQGGSTNYTVSYTAGLLGGVAITPTFSIAGGIPTGVTVAFSPSSVVAAGGTTTATVSTTGSTPAATSVITFGGASGATTGTTTTASLIVTAPVAHQTLISSASYGAITDINALGFTDWFLMNAYSINGTGNVFGPATAVGTHKSGGSLLTGMTVGSGGPVISMRPPGYGTAPSIGWTGGDSGGSTSPMVNWYGDQNTYSIPIVAPAGIGEHTLYLYLGLNNNGGQTGTLTCTMSDGSTSPLVTTWTGAGGGNNYDPHLVVIKYAAASNSQTYSCAVQSTLTSADVQAVGII